MNPTVKVIIYPVKDIAKSKELFQRFLGVEPTSDAPYYVGFKIGDIDIGLDPNGHASGMTGPVIYWQVTDIKESLQQLLAVGAQTQQEVRDVGGGMLIATVLDADGNPIGLRQLPQ